MFKFRKLALLLLLLSVVCGKTVSAQSYYKDDNRTFYGGVSLGATFSQIQGDNYAGFHKTGFTGGAIVYAELATNFAASMELLYAQKGLKSHKEEYLPYSGIRVYNYDIKLNYAELPILLNYFDKKRSHFGLGVAYAQLISSDEQILTDSATVNAIDLNTYPFKKYDLNGVVSANLHLGKSIFLNIRYQRSLISIRDAYYAPIHNPEVNTQVNQNWVIKVMYLFE